MLRDVTDANNLLMGEGILYPSSACIVNGKRKFHLRVS